MGFPTLIVISLLHGRCKDDSFCILWNCNSVVCLPFKEMLGKPGLVWLTIIIYFSTTRNYNSLVANERSPSTGLFNNPHIKNIESFLVPQFFNFLHSHLGVSKGLVRGAYEAVVRGRDQEKRFTSCQTVLWSHVSASDGQ